MPHVFKTKTNRLGQATTGTSGFAAEPGSRCPMTQYVWTLRAPGRQDIQRVTTLEEMQDALMQLELPGGVPPVWILTNTGSSDDAGHGHYTHNAGGTDEWSLTWIKLDS